MELTQFLVLLFLVFAAAYFGMCGAIYLVRRLKKNNMFDFSFPLGLALVLPILIFTPFIDKSAQTALYLTGVASFGLLALFLAAHPFKPTQKYIAFGLFSFAATYLLPTDMPLFQTGLALNTFMHVVLAAALMGFMYLFAWLDKVPFLSLTTSLAFTALTVLFSAVLHILPMPAGIFALFLVTTQMGVSFCLKPYMPFRLGTYGAYAFGFLWGFIGLYCAAVGYPDIAVFSAGYYLTEFVFVLVISLLHQRILSLQAPFLIERAIQKNILVARIFRTILLYTIMLGVLGFWNTRSDTYSFTIIALMFIGYLVYQFLNWDVRPTFKGVFGELKNGLNDLKKEIINVKQLRAQMVAKKVAQKTTLKTAKQPSVQKKKVTGKPALQKKSKSKTVKSTVQQKAQVKRVVTKRATKTVQKTSKAPTKRKTKK